MAEDVQTLNVSDAAAAVRDGRSSSRALVDACLERIETREDEVRAWRHLEPGAARAQADERDDAGAPAGRLHGVPVGIKDIIDTEDQPTACGSPIYEGRRPETDAACVARLRAAGAVILGKTVTTEFAAFKPPVTRNPHDPARTPGGSSSGSAAAVACGMVPAALGSQTAGSVIRPAAFCGVVGFKPSYGAIDITGVKAFAPALDTLGVFARTVEDAAMVARVIGGGVGPLADAVPEALTPPRIGLCRPREWGEACETTRGALETTLDRLAEAGAVIGAFDMPAPFADLVDKQNEIMIGQATDSLAYEYRTHRDLLSDVLRAALEDAMAWPPSRLSTALEIAAARRDQAEELFGAHDLLLTPSAPGEAPTPETTGNPVFNRVWTALYVPCITLPIGSGPDGLPIGAQVVARFGDDGRLLAWAQWAESALRS